MRRRLQVCLFLLVAFTLSFPQDSYNMTLVGVWMSPGGEDFACGLGYRPLTVIGDRAFIAARDKIYAVDISDPSHPSLDTTFGSGTSLCTDGEYLFATDGYCFRRYNPTVTYPTLIDSYCCPGMHIVGFSCAASQNATGDTGVIVTWDWTGIFGRRYLPEWSLYTVSLGGVCARCLWRGVYIDYPVVMRLWYRTYDDTFEGIYGIEELKVVVFNPLTDHTAGFDTTSYSACGPGEGFYPFDIAGNDSLVFVTRDNGFIGCWRIEEPGSIYALQHLCDWRMSEGWQWLDLEGNILYAGAAGGVFVFDISDPAHPETLGYAFGAFGMYVCGRDSFVYSCNTGALYIHKIEGMQTGEVDIEREYDYALSPNPVSPNRLVRLKGEAKKLEIYDIKGRLIYDTKNAEFFRAPRECGIYLVRIVLANGAEAVKKILVMP